MILAVTGAYLQLMATSALIEEQRVEVQYAEASFKQARAQADAGNKAPIDANRGLVELQTEQQRLRSQTGDLEKQKNALARLIGLPLGISISISEKLETQPFDAAPVEDLVHRAWAQRQDLKAAEAQLNAALEARKAASDERLPSAKVEGFYGIEGTNPNKGNGIFQASASVNIPIFSGGRLHADTVQADATVTERKAELSNERGAVELDVRNAFIDLSVANDQVKTAESNRTTCSGNFAPVPRPICSRSCRLCRGRQLAGSAGRRRPRLRQQLVLSEFGNHHARSRHGRSRKRYSHPL